MSNQQYELLQAVFEVKKYVTDLRDAGYTDPGMTTIADIVYVRLDNGLTRGAALKILRDEVILRHKTSHVKFMFWCDTYTASYGSPKILAHPAVSR